MVQRRFLNQCNVLAQESPALQLHENLNFTDIPRRPQFANLINTEGFNHLNHKTEDLKKLEYAVFKEETFFEDRIN